MYEVRGTIAIFARVARRKVVCLASHTRRKGLNEPGEDFIGTRVGPHHLRLRFGIMRSGAAGMRSRCERNIAFSQK